MSKYGSVISDALESSVKPAIMKAVEAACGADWYARCGREVLRGYPDYEKIETALQKGMPLRQALDIVGLMYILFPYEKKEDGTLQHNDSPVTYRLTERFDLQNWQVGKLRRIRIIRNTAEHGAQEETTDYTLEQITAGAPEKAWLAELEQTAAILQPGISLAEYKRELERKIAKAAAEQGSIRVDSIFMTETLEARRELRRYNEQPFLQAPIAQPMVGAAPWAKCAADLNELPWPSVVASEQQAQAKKQPLSQRDQVIGALFGDEKTRETVIKAADVLEKSATLGLEKGLGKLLGKFGRK